MTRRDPERPPSIARAAGPAHQPGTGRPAPPPGRSEAIEGERRRLLAVYAARDRRPEREGEDRYFRASRRRAFDRLRGDRPMDQLEVLEIGCGAGGWLVDLAERVDTAQLAGVDLDAGRIAIARDHLPGADLRVGCGSELPWEAARFDLVILSTLLSSIRLAELRAAIAFEARRVLRPSGRILVYDLRYPNPWNHDVEPVSSGRIRRLFSGCCVRSTTCTLLPPLARRMPPRLASLLERWPPLRSHRLDLIEPGRGLRP